MATKAELEALVEELKKENDTLKETNPSNEESERLRNENEKMTSQLAQMQAQLSMLMTSMQTREVEKKNESPITFTCAYDACGLRGQNQTYTLTQFQSRSFNRNEAFYVAQSVKDAIINGGIYVDDEDFVKENNLYDDSNFIIPLDTLIHIKEMKSEEVISLYKKTTKAQKDIISSMFYKDYIAENNPNYNVLHAIGFDVSD